MARSDKEVLQDKLGKPLVALTADQWVAVLEHIDTEIEAALDQAVQGDAEALDSLKASEDLRDAIRQQLGLEELISDWDESVKGRNAG